MGTASRKFTLNWIDAGKGLVVAGGTSVLYFVQQSLDAGSMQFHWKGVAMAFISGAVAYLLKNWFTGPKSEKP
jgi:membrane protein implicated in regulation of membrane protease activity